MDGSRVVPDVEPDGPFFVPGLALIGLFALAVRVMHLDIPLRYDEAVTWLEFASGSWTHAATWYSTPNNHILHTLAVKASTALFGSDPWAIRLPALLAGSALPVAVGWTAARLLDARVGLLAAALVATSPVLVEYSVNARGYALLALSVVLLVGVTDQLLRNATRDRWIAWVGLGVLGFYTVPLMVIPWTGLWLWLLFDVVDVEGPWQFRVLRLRPLALASAATLAFAVVLYAPVVMRNGADALLANRFVEGMGWVAFAGSIPEAVADIAGHWVKGVPAPLWLLGLAGLAVAAVPGHPLAARRPLSLAWALAFGALQIMLVKRNMGEARVWLWALPLVFVAVAAGLVRAADYVAARRRATGALALLGLLWVAAQSWALLHLDPVRRSLETGTFLEVEEVASYLAERVRPGDALVTDFVSREPLRYYLYALGVPPTAISSDVAEGGRAWVVINAGDPVRDSVGRLRAESLGVPLADSDPLEHVGPVVIYGFGQNPAANDTLDDQSRPRSDARSSASSRAPSRADRTRSDP